MGPALPAIHPTLLPGPCIYRQHEADHSCEALTAASNRANAVQEPTLGVHTRGGGVHAMGTHNRNALLELVLLGPA